MADKINQNRAKDLELDDEIEIPGFDDIALDDPFGGNGSSDPGGRKPAGITKEHVIEGFKGVGSGLGQGFTNEIYKAVPNARPIVSEIKQGFDDLRDLKENISKQVGPMVTTLESSARKLLPKAQKLMPAKMYNKIKNKLDERHASRQAESEAGQQQTKESFEAATIADAISSVFGNQLDAQRASELNEEKNRLTDIAIESSRHKKTTAQLQHVYDAVRGTELFHRTIHTAYLKKSLELKYKHLFVARDTYNLLAKSMATFEEYFRAITKNTMLPDMAKIEIGDYHRKNITQHYGEMMASFLGNFRKKILGTIKGKVLNAVSALGNMTDMVGQGADMAEMAGDMGMDMRGTMFNMGGNLLGKWLGGPIAKRALGKISPILKNANRGLGNFSESIALKGANLRRKMENSDNRILNFLADFLPALTPQYSGSNDLVDKGDKPATFDLMTRQSIVEIIPGYLSKMLQSIEKLRTGDDETQQEIYNVYKRRFTTVDELKEGVAEKMYGSEDTRRRAFQGALATLQTGITRNGKAEGEDVTTYYKKYQKDINRFLINHAVHAQFLDTNAIADYLTSPDGTGGQPYVDSVTKGFENSPKDVLKAIYEGLIDSEGNIDKRLAEELSMTINNYRKMDSYKSEAPKLTEFYGYRHVLADQVSEKRKAALQKAAAAGDQKAAKELKKRAGIISDTNALDLSGIASAQADINYDQLNTQYDLNERLEQMKDSDAARAQMEDLKERFGYNAIARKFQHGKETAAKKFTTVKEKVADVAEDVAETFTKWRDEAINFGEKFVTDPMYREQVLSDLEAKGMDALAAGKKSGEEIIDFVRRAREDPKAAYEEIKATAQKAVDSAKETAKNAKPIFQKTVNNAKENIKKFNKKQAKRHEKRRRAKEAKRAAQATPVPSAVPPIPPEESTEPTESIEPEEIKPTSTTLHSVINGRKSDGAYVPPSAEQPTVDNAELRKSIESLRDVIAGLSDSLSSTAAKATGETTVSSIKVDNDALIDVVKEFMSSCQATAEARTAQFSDWRTSMETGFSTVTEEISKVTKGATFINATPDDGHWLGRKTKGAVGKAFNAAKGVAKGVANYAGTVYAGALKGLGTAAKGLGNAAAAGFGYAKDVTHLLIDKPNYVDIYRKGEEGGSPLVTARQQKEDPGVVFASTGKRVMRSKDINEPIKDARTGNILITEDDLKHGLSIPDGSPLGNLFKGAGKVLTSYFGFYGKVAAAAIKGVAALGKAVIGGLLGKSSDPYCDIYLKDGKSEKPILTRLKQARDPGVIFENGERVKYSADIHEPVYDPVEKDAAGKPLCLISQDDIDTGLVDANGKRLSMAGGSKGLFSKLADIGKSLAPGVGHAFGKGMDLYSFVFKGLFGLGLKGAQGVGKVLARVFGIDVAEGTKVNKELLETVKAIREDVGLLAAGKKKNSNDKDGDGDIDGTYQDQMSRKKKEKGKDPTRAAHVDVDWRKKKEELDAKNKAAEGGGDGKSGSSKVPDWFKKKFGKWFKDSKFVKNNKWLKHGGRRLKALGKLTGSKSLKGLAKGGKWIAGLGGKAMPFLAKGGAAAMHGLGAMGSAAGGVLGSAGTAIGSGLSSLGGLFGLGGGAAAAGAGAAGSAAAGTAAAGTAAAAGGAGAAGLGSSIAAMATNPVTLGVLGALAAGYGVYRGVKGFNKKNALKNVGESEGISKENQLTGEDRMYSALGMNTKFGAKAMKFVSKGLGIHGLIKGIRGNDNPLTDKEIEQGRAKLNRKIEKGLPGYDRILQEYEKAVEAGNWRRARELCGKEADGLIKSLWKHSFVGATVSGISNVIFGNKDKEMSKEEIKKVHDKFNSIMKKGGSKAKNAERLLNKFDDYVAEGNWKKAREIAGMEKRGLFGKLFQDSKGNVQWGKVLGLAAGGIVGYGIGALFTKADKNAPMTEKEVTTERQRLQKLAEGGNKQAEKILAQFDEAVTEMNWKKARHLCGKDVQSNLKKFGKAMQSTMKWTRRIGTLGLSMLFESDQEKPLSDAEISKYTKMMQARADHGSKISAKRLEKFNDAVAKQDWKKAREIAKMPDKMAVTKAAKAVGDWLFGNNEKPMTEAEISKFRESMQRKIKMGSRAAQKKLDKFNDAVEEERWERARGIARMKDDGVIMKGLKKIGDRYATTWRFLFGGDKMAMSENEIEAARKQFRIDIDEGKRGAQKRSDMFEDYVADEKWDRARKIAKLPYENVVKRSFKAAKNWLFGNEKDALTPEEIEKFQNEMEQKSTDGDPKASKILAAFNHAVEMENWKKARAISKIKAGGAVGSVVKGVKGIWNFLTGKKDYEDCQKMREKLDDKATEDESGLVEAAITKFDTLVRRQKYNDAVALGKDILKMKPNDLAKKHKLTSDSYEALKKQAEDLDKKIQKQLDSDTSILPSIKSIRLKSLRSDLRNSSDWSDDFFEECRDRYSNITGEDIFSDDKMEGIGDDVVKQGKILLQDVDRTNEKFSWLGSPLVKMRLNNLRNEIRSDVTAWDPELFDEWRDKLREIAGKDAVATKPPEWQSPEDARLQHAGETLVKDIDKINDKFSWFGSPLKKRKLGTIKNMLQDTITTGGLNAEYIEEIKGKIKDVAGDEAKFTDVSTLSDAQVTVGNDASQLVKDIDATSEKFSWITSPFLKRKLSSLKNELESSVDRWGPSYFQDVQKRLKDIAGEDAVISRLKAGTNEEVEKKLQEDARVIAENIDKTSEKFSWLGSPFIKKNLAALKTQLNAQPDQWSTEYFQKVQDRIREIAGTEAVVSRLNKGTEEEEANIQKDADQIISDISRTDENFSWLGSPFVKKNLNALKAEFMASSDKWGKDYFKQIQQRLINIAGVKDSVVTDMISSGNEADMADLMKNAKTIMSDIDQTNDKFSWLGSPFVKKNLNALKSEVESSSAKWGKEYFTDVQKRLKDIAGDEAVLSKLEHKSEGEKSEEKTSDGEKSDEESGNQKKSKEMTPKEKAERIKSLKKKQFEARFGGESLSASEKEELDELENYDSKEVTKDGTVILRKNTDYDKLFKENPKLEETYNRLAEQQTANPMSAYNRETDPKKKEQILLNLRKSIGDDFLKKQKKAKDAAEAKQFEEELRGNDKAGVEEYDTKMKRMKNLEMRAASLEKKGKSLSDEEDAELQDLQKLESKGMNAFLIGRKKSSEQTAKNAPVDKSGATAVKPGKKHAQTAAKGVQSKSVGAMTRGEAARRKQARNEFLGTGALAGDNSKQLAAAGLIRECYEMLDNDTINSIIEAISGKDFDKKDWAEDINHEFVRTLPLMWAQNKDNSPDSVLPQSVGSTLLTSIRSFGGSFRNPGIEQAAFVAQGYFALHPHPFSDELDKLYKDEHGGASPGSLSDECYAACNPGKSLFDEGAEPAEGEVKLIEPVKKLTLDNAPVDNVQTNAVQTASSKASPSLVPELSDYGKRLMSGESVEQPASTQVVDTEQRQKAAIKTTEFQPKKPEERFAKGGFVKKFALGGIGNFFQNLTSSNGMGTDNEMVDAMYNHIVKNYDKYLRSRYYGNPYFFITQECPMTKDELPEGFDDTDPNAITNDTVEALANKVNELDANSEIPEDILKKYKEYEEQGKWSALSEEQDGMSANMQRRIEGTYKPQKLGFVDRMRERSRYAEADKYAFATGGFLGSTNNGRFQTKTKNTFDASGQPIQYGEAGTEAIMPIRNRPGNLLSRIGRKLNGILNGKPVGPIGTDASKASVHAGTDEAEPMENMMASELSKSIKPQPSHGGDLIRKIHAPSFTELLGKVNPLTAIKNAIPKFAPARAIGEPGDEGLKSVAPGASILAKATTKMADVANDLIGSKPTPMPPAAGATMGDDKYAQLIEQNQKLIDLLTSVITNGGLKVSGMEALIESTINNAPLPSAPSQIIGDNAGPVGLDLRKKQC